MVGNGDFLPITHVGSIAITALKGNLTLEDVLVCPAITKFLLSVSKLTSDYPCEFIFDSDIVYVKDKSTSQVLSLGRKHEGLYLLENPQFFALYSSKQQITSDDICHKRLAYRHQQILQHLSSIKAISFNKVAQHMCESCQLGKFCKLLQDFIYYVCSSYPPSRTHIHHVWGLRVGLHIWTK